MANTASSETREFRNYFNAATPLNQMAQSNTNMDSLGEIAMFINDDETINTVFEGKHNDLSAPISEYLEALIQAMQNMHVNEDVVDDVTELHNLIDSRREFIGGSPEKEFILKQILGARYMGDSEGYNKALQETIRKIKSGVPYADAF